MTVRARDYLAQFDAGVFPVLSLISIAEIVGRARAVEHYQSAKILFAAQHMTQRRTQRRDAGSHRDENQVLSARPIQIKSMPSHTEQIDLVAWAHIKKRAAHANGSLDQDLQLTIFRRAGKREVCRLFLVHAQNRNLPGNKVDAVRITSIDGQQIERANVAPLIEYLGND